MPADANARGSHQRDRAALAVASLCLAKEYPVVSAAFAHYGREVLPGDPAFAFLRVSAHAPLPQGLEDCVIYIGEGLLGADMSVVHSPALDLGVEPFHQLARSNCLVSLHDFSDIG